MDRSNNKLKMLYKCITTNTSAIWQHAAHSTDQVTSSIAAKLEPYKKAYLLTKNNENVSGRS